MVGGDTTPPTARSPGLQIPTPLTPLTSPSVVLSTHTMLVGAMAEVPKMVPSLAT